MRSTVNSLTASLFVRVYECTLKYLTCTVLFVQLTLLHIIIKQTSQSFFYKDIFPRMLIVWRPLIEVSALQKKVGGANSHIVLKTT